MLFAVRATQRLAADYIVMKDDLREKYKIKRRYFGNIVRDEADRNILENFMAAYGGCESYFIYRSFGSEASTRMITEELLARGKRVLLPRTEGDVIVPVPYGQLKRGRFGIEEPAGAPYDGAIDVAVVPLLAVNSRGYRLGYGGGYYDAYFAAHPGVARVGLCYEAQRTDRLPHEAHDVPLQAVVTERGVVLFEDGSPARRG